MWGSFRNIIEEQYLLARKCSIPPSESNLYADFERQIYVNLVLKEMAEEREAIQGKTGKGK